MNWDVILNIIYFLLSLTVLVSIHELGHLSMAKLFDVYCEEYSIGFGPKIITIEPKGFNRKGKPRETKFSIRWIPLGGYVAMAGEGMEDEESLKQVPPQRFLQGIAKWKRAIIMIAGVVLNFVLGFLLLLGSVVSGPQANYKEAKLNVSYVAYNATEEDPGTVLFTDEYTLKSIEITSTINGTTTEKTYTITEGTLFENESIQNYLNGIKPAETINDSMSFEFNFVDRESISFSRQAVQVNEESLSWDNMLMTSYSTFRPNFGETFVLTCDRFGDSCIAIYKALGQIFTKEGLNNLGGPIAIVQQQMQVVESGFSSFLYFWGLISCNLAIFNLLPFPGLDGWHFLVLIIEGITKKEINPKVKSIMSLVGMILLFGLMIVVTFKDIINLFMLML